MTEWSLTKQSCVRKTLKWWYFGKKTTEENALIPPPWHACFVTVVYIWGRAPHNTSRLQEFRASVPLATPRSAGIGVCAQEVTAPLGSADTEACPQGLLQVCLLTEPCPWKYTKLGRSRSPHCELLCGGARVVRKLKEAASRQATRNWGHQQPQANGSFSLGWALRRLTVWL